MQLGTDTVISISRECVLATETSGQDMAGPPRDAPGSWSTVMTGWRAESSQVHEPQEGSGEPWCADLSYRPVPDRGILIKPSAFPSHTFRSPILPPRPRPPPAFGIPGLGEPALGRPWFTQQVSGTGSTSGVNVTHAISAADRWREESHSSIGNAWVSSAPVGLAPRDRYRDAGSQVFRRPSESGNINMDRRSATHPISAAGGWLKESRTSIGVPYASGGLAPRGEYRDAGTQVSRPPTESGDMDIDSRPSPPSESGDIDMDATTRPPAPTVEDPQSLPQSTWSGNRGTSGSEIIALMHQLRGSVRHIAAFIAAAEDTSPARESVEYRMWKRFLSNM